MNDRMLALLRTGGPLAPPAGAGSAKVPLACTGTVLMDFPGPGLIQAIISLNPGVPKPPTVFTDVAGTPYESAIYAMAERGIILGFDDQSFRPGQAVTRQQFAKMIVKTLGFVVTGTEVCPFHRCGRPGGPRSLVSLQVRGGLRGARDHQGHPPPPSSPRRTSSTSDSSPWWCGRPAWPIRRADHQARLHGRAVRPVRALSERQEGGVRGLLDGLLGIGPSYDFFAASTRGECAQMLYNLAKMFEP